MQFIIALDPGNKSGLTYGFSNEQPVTALHDFTPKPKTTKRRAEDKHLRYGKLWDVLNKISIVGLQPDSITIICEGAAGFTKGKSAVEVSNKYRGVVECFAAIRNCNYISIQPNDLQRWATGKGRAEKTEMIAVASKRYGFKGTDDNEADSLLLWHFAKEQADLTEFALAKPTITNFP